MNENRFVDGLDVLVARRRAGLKQWELAARLGVSSTVVCDIEHGRRGLTAQMQTRIVEALQLPGPARETAALR